MKREALKHPKMLDLSTRLNIPRGYAVGLVTLLLDWTSDMAPQGNVGKWPNAVIAKACEWDGDADVFIKALIQSGWLDESPKHRLLIHGLKKHSEQWWKRKLTRLGLVFLTDDEPVTSQQPVTGHENVSAKQPTEGVASRDRTEPNPTEPNPTEPGCREEGGQKTTTTFDENEHGCALAWRWVLKRQPGPSDDTMNLVPIFAEQIRLGRSAKAMLADILTDNRDRSELFWQWKKRFVENNGTSPPSTISLEESRAAVEEEMRQRREELAERLATRTKRKLGTGKG